MQSCLRSAQDAYFVFKMSGCLHMLFTNQFQALAEDYIRVDKRYLILDQTGPTYSVLSECQQRHPSSVSLSLSLSLSLSHSLFLSPSLCLSLSVSLSLSLKGIPVHLFTVNRSLRYLSFNHFITLIHPLIRSRGKIKGVLSHQPPTRSWSAKAFVHLAKSCLSEPLETQSQVSHSEYWSTLMLIYNTRNYFSLKKRNNCK